MTEVTQTKCPHCGASMKAYWHRLTPGLVNTLIHFRLRIIDKGKNDIHLPYEMELSSTQYNNFQKLRYHALVAKVKSDGEHRRGHWLLTRRGASFLNGELSVPARVMTFRNKVKAHSEELVSVHEVIKDGTMPHFESIDDFDYDIIDVDIFDELEPTVQAKLFD